MADDQLLQMVMDCDFPFRYLRSITGFQIPLSFSLTTSQAWELQKLPIRK